MMSSSKWWFLMAFCSVLHVIQGDTLMEDLSARHPQLPNLDVDDDLEEVSARRPQMPILGAELDVEIIQVDHYNCSWCGNADPDANDERAKITPKTWNIDIAPNTCNTISTPNYPRKYPKNIDYRYYYTTHSMASFHINIPTGGIQWSTGCHRDKLSVMNSTGTLIQRCGRIRNFNMDSGSYFYVRFETNHRLQWHGYTGTICASPVKSTTTKTTTTTTITTTTTTTPPPQVPVSCDDVCGNLTYYSNSGPSGRINAGITAPHLHPWYVIIDIIRTKIIVRCSGYLISRHHVITSAYCFEQTDETGIENTTVRLTAGEYDLTALETPLAQIVFTHNITIYPGYDHTIGTGVKNLALITLEGSGFILNERVFPVCIHSPGMALPPKVEIAGYGWTSFNYPAVNMTQITLSTCPFPIAPDLQCLFMANPEATTCNGDAGAPMVYLFNGRYFSIGHINTITNPSCPLPGGIHPAVKLSFFKSWIDSVTSSRICTPNIYEG